MLLIYNHPLVSCHVTPVGGKHVLCQSVRDLVGPFRPTRRGEGLRPPPGGTVSPYLAELTAHDGWRACSTNFRFSRQFDAASQ